MRKLLSSILLLAGATLLPAARNLEVYCIDVEGGKATLWISPSGESMLVDTGYAGFSRRDADRILAAAWNAGIRKIDYLLITHYHKDHAGGVPQLAEKIPVRNFIDHGPSSEKGQDEDVIFNAYSAFRDKGNHILAKVGDTLPIRGMEVKFVSSDGNLLDAPLPGAGQPNPDCAGFPKPAPEPDQPENARSVGTLITFGSLRFLDMGDLTSDKEYDLVCPNNKLGVVDVFMVSHHGSSFSDSLPFVRAVHPRVAIMNNGPRKGGAPEVWQRIHEIPGLEDLWQLHFSIAAGKEHNSPDTFIANVDEICQGQWLKLTARPDGAFTIYNSRNKYQREYRKR
jgi:beta-lactamase superfamily II metal-dependent hydrolase